MLGKKTLALRLATIAAVAVVLAAEPAHASRVSLDRAKIIVDSLAVSPSPSPEVSHAPIATKARPHGDLDRAKIIVDSVVMTAEPTPIMAPAQVRGSLNFSDLMDTVDDTPSPTPVVTRAPGHAGFDRAKIIVDSIAATPEPTPIVTKAQPHGGLDRARNINSR